MSNLADAGTFDYTNARQEELDALSPVIYGLTPGERKSLVQGFVGARNFDAVNTLGRHFGFDTSDAMTNLLEIALKEGRETGAATTHDGSLSLIDHVTHLLNSGADPNRIQNINDLLPETSDPDLNRAVAELMSDPSRAQMFTSSKTDEPQVTASSGDHVALLRRGSGQHWQKDPSGKIYLELPDAQTICDVSGTLSRYGVRQSYGWPGVLEGKTAVIIPAGVLDDMTTSEIVNAGKAVGHTLGTDPLPEFQDPAKPTPTRLAATKPAPGVD